MTDPEQSWDALIEGLRDGDPGVVSGFYARYGPLLERLADQNLAAGLRRRVGPEDVVGSACRTFLRRIQDGQFELDGGERVWNLLCAITLAKARKHARHHLRQKRGVGREVSVDGGRGSGEGPRVEASSPGPTPAEAAEFADQFQHLIGSMDEEEQQIVLLKLQRLTNDEVAAKLGCSERTVRRILQRVQARLVAEGAP